MADHNHPESRAEGLQPDPHSGQQGLSVPAQTVAPDDGIRLPQRQEDGRVRYLPSREEEKSGTTGVTPVQAKKPGRLKRWTWALLMPVVLALGGVLVASLIGERGILSTFSVLETLWLPVTVFRLALYVLVAWVFWPRMMQGFKARAFDNLYARKTFLQEQNALDYEALEALNADARRIENARIPSWMVFTFCLVLEVAFVQLPYHMIARGLPL